MPPFVVALLVLLHAALAWFGRAPGVLTRQDDARYLMLARALRHGTYRDVMWPGAPWHHMYPPGYPALLALWTSLGGERFGWLVLLQIALSAGTLALMAAVLARVVRPAVAVAALAVLAVNPFLLTWAGQVASEGALAFCFALALWGAACHPPGRRQVAVVVTAALLAPLMRTAGSVLPAVVVLDWLLARRHRDAALMTLLALVVVGGLLVWTLADPTAVAGSSYAADLAVTKGAHASLLHELARRIVRGAVFYPTQSVPGLLPFPTVPGTLVDNVVGVAIVVVGLVAGTARWLVRCRLGALLLLASAALFLVWPYQVGRYVVPLLPVLVPVLLDGVARVASWRPASARGASGRAAGSARGATRGGAIAVALVAAVTVGTGIRADRARVAPMLACRRAQPLPDARCVTADQASFFRAVRWVADSLPPAARIASAKSEPLAYYTGRTTVPYAPLARADAAHLVAALHAARADYVLLGALQARERSTLAPRLAERCAELRLVATFPPHTYLFRVVEPARPDVDSAAASAAACAAVRDYLRETVPLD